jgi:hypothetical protein
LSAGRFSVINHSREEKKDYYYERDHVNKVAKVQPLDEKL